MAQMHKDDPNLQVKDLRMREDRQVRKESQARRHSIAMWTSTGIAMSGLCIAVVATNHGLHQGDDERPDAGAMHENAAGPNLRERMEKLGNKELIGKLGRMEQPTSQTAVIMFRLRHHTTDSAIIEYNTASSILESRGEAAVPDLVYALSHNPSGFVRMSVAYSLGIIGHDSALPELKTAEGYDEDMHVRLTAARAREEIVKKRQTELMSPLSNNELIGKIFKGDLNDIRHPPSETEFLEHEAAASLLEARGRAAVPDLVNALFHEKNRFVRKSVVYMLYVIRDESALPPLEDAAETDKDPDVKKAADQAVEVIEEERDKGYHL